MENQTQGSFQQFYTDWKDKQKQQLDLLVVASKSDSPPPTPSSLSLLVDRVVSHYENYYTAKSKCAETDVLLLLSPPWTTSLEDAFIWIGGWPPTTAFHLLYSKSGLQFEAKFAAAGGCGSGGAVDLGGLSSDQMQLIDELQRRTIMEERKITEKAAKQQERVADAEMVELSHESSRVDSNRVESTLNSRKEGFQNVLQSADRLRLVTLKAVVGILSPIQAVHFLTAAGELLLKLHDWGREKEDKQHTSNQAVASTLA